MYPGSAAVSAHANAVTEGIKQVLLIWRTPKTFHAVAGRRLAVFPPFRRLLTQLYSSHPSKQHFRLALAATSV